MSKTLPDLARDSESSGAFFSTPTGVRTGVWKSFRLFLGFAYTHSLTHSVRMKFISFDLEGEFVLEFDHENQ